MKTRENLRRNLEQSLTLEWSEIFRCDFDCPGLNVGPFFRCILCGGIAPTELAKINYAAEALGHKDECENKR